MNHVTMTILYLFQQLISNIFKMKILLKNIFFFTFQKEPHHGGESKENQ
jgi:hypothetical protein